MSKHTHKQMRASDRNWTKARLIGFLSIKHSQKQLTDFERNELSVALLAVETIISNWSDETLQWKLNNLKKDERINGLGTQN
jgi:hypothetical protein